MGNLQQAIKARRKPRETPEALLAALVKANKGLSITLGEREGLSRFINERPSLAREAREVERRIDRAYRRATEGHPGAGREFYRVLEEYQEVNRRHIKEFIMTRRKK